MDSNEILPYVEPIFRFCCKRLSNRHDAEDLASEIVCHALEGMKKYHIESLDAWVWRIAHNRYARLIHARNQEQSFLTGDEMLLSVPDADPFTVTDEPERDYEEVFRYLHTLSSSYRNIFIDHYLGELDIRALAVKYALPETTVKWRLHVGREKIRTRIGENGMEKVYNRINWNTSTCNGSMNPNQYLHTQIARAICQAAYEKPLTVEEISLCTGIPAMYIEDELPRLEYGDAICKVGNKYATNFIVFRLQDRKAIETVSASLVTEVADKLEALLRQNAEAVKRLDFYGHDFGMERLGYILIPYLLRQKVRSIKQERLHLENGPYPQRKDGGYGWFLVEETPDANEFLSEYSTGCNGAGDDDGSKYAFPSHIYYYWIGKYFHNGIYHNGGTRWMCAHGIPQNSKNGFIEKDALSEEDAARLLQKNLIRKADGGYQLQFACFTEAQFTALVSLFKLDDGGLDDSLATWLMAVRNSFGKFVPARLDDQINQWVSNYWCQIIGYVTDELIRRGVLRKPDPEKPLTDGVFYVEGNYAL
ncbi:MAG: sigma-70 family RNA polymerase sigma factor [Oscillospiraceae bacterium]|nr:sigma-70 family RNA polymerase sigma factor [Oscillospiraceae bacterium]